MRQAATAVARGDAFLCLDLTETKEVNVVVWRMGAQGFVEAFTTELDASDRVREIEHENCADAVIVFGPKAVMS